MSEDETIEILLDNKKEYERIIKELDDVRDANGNKSNETIQDCQKFVQAIEIILDLYKQEKEKNKELEDENTKLSEEITENICKGAEEDVLEEYRQQLKNSISKDKIKAKIEGIKKCKKRIKDKYLVFSRQDIFDYQIYILQELLLEDN